MRARGGNAPTDTNGRSQRASRPVPFDARGDLWAAVGEGVIFSEDLNGRLQFDPITPPPLRAAAAAPAPLPYQCQRLPPTSAPAAAGHPPRPPRPSRPLQPPHPPPPALVRPPLGEVALNVLTTELKSLEDENDALKRHVALQDRVIVGFCRLHVYERENARPPTASRLET